LLGIVSIGTAELNGKWNSTSIADQVTLTAKFRSVSWIWSRLRPPKTARTEQLSTTALDQTIRE
jgi:hypothetical protein